MRNLVNFASFQAGWFACVLGASAGKAWIGVATVGALLVLHLGWTRRERARREAILLALAACVGCGVEAANLALGVYAPASGLGLASPLFYVWMAAFWANFAATLNVSMSWLRGRAALAAAFGAIGGPLAFAGAAKLGALTLGGNLLASHMALGVEWALATPLLLALAARVDREGAPIIACRCAECA